MNLRAMLGEVGASEGGFDFRNQKFCAVWRRGDKNFGAGRGPPQIPELEGDYRQSGNAAQLCSDLGTLSFVLLHV